MKETGDKISGAFQVFGDYMSTKATTLKEKSQEIAQSEKFQKMKNDTKEGINVLSERV